MAKSNRGSMPAPAAKMPPPVPVAKAAEVQESAPAAAAAPAKKGSKKAAPAGGIEVRATRDGFWQGDRKTVDSAPFTVPEFSDLGEWMQCLDPATEKLRVAHFAKKRADNLAKSREKEERE
ncbi:MAG: hypothetical protein ACRCV5_19150 [Afipia sp.]